MQPIIFRVLALGGSLQRLQLIYHAEKVSLGSQLIDLAEELI